MHACMHPPVVLALGPYPFLSKSDCLQFSLSFTRMTLLASRLIIASSSRRRLSVDRVSVLFVCTQEQPISEVFPCTFGPKTLKSGRASRSTARKYYRWQAAWGHPAHRIRPGRVSWVPEAAHTQVHDRFACKRTLQPTPVSAHAGFARAPPGMCVTAG